MSRGFYWFACADFPSIYARAPQLSENTKIKQFGETEADALAKVQAFAREKVAPFLAGFETAPPIKASSIMFRPTLERKAKP